MCFSFHKICILQGKSVSLYRKQSIRPEVYTGVNTEVLGHPDSGLFLVSSLRDVSMLCNCPHFKKSSLYLSGSFWVVSSWWCPEGFRELGKREVFVSSLLFNTTCLYVKAWFLCRSKFLPQSSLGTAAYSPWWGKHEAWGTGKSP